ncbi:hypothetical protein ACLB90_01300 [Stenotrophomonas sp. LGBM10]|uniref:hypothetical protein n=1 Tax=Stenotrophomonas sp. LGBM10 TaxID=3390038 RepID=UPI00398B3CD3
MYLIRPFLMIALTLVPLAVPMRAAADAAPYLGLLNRAHDSITAVAAAPAGTDAFAPVAIDPLPGGGGGTTVQLGVPGCRFDLRLTFRTGHRAVYQGVDVCRGDTLVIAPLPR